MRLKDSKAAPGISGFSKQPAPVILTRREKEVSLLFKPPFLSLLFLLSPTTLFFFLFFFFSAVPD